ncbi:MAG: ral secretory pathway protein type pilus assembly protein PilB [Candidatus Saccharibacteria bacterium]|nr:ral secretory pathway protein type pilus assembly protein PilB [Candidatus Saccharibacteria bacterium]
MRIPDSLVEELLSKNGSGTKEQLAELREQEEKEKKPLQDLVIRNNLMTEKELTKLYAAEIEVPFVELNGREIKHDILKQLPERIARQYNAVVFDVDKDGTRQVAMQDPDDIQALNFLQKQLGTDIKVNITTTSLLQAALDQYRGNISSELTKVIADEGEADEGEEIDESDLAEDSPVAQTVNIIIEYGVKAGASDIHIEPREDFVVVRYRIDGLLREANKLPRKMLGSLVSRIKILSNLKIDEHRAPQDGRFKIEVSGLVYALRVSTLPILDGEKVVMRILNESTKPADFTELGFWGTALTVLQQAITQPHGMVLVTGPTGSGKSTTLFSVLSSLNSPNVNISTVEDPIEYHIVGANQVQVNPVAGMTFINGLRALLRQDPNIIMVGEIRDGETADLGVQAALTGHLVFSTLHTNNAATCLPRLLDMGVEPFLIASTVRVIVAQRLVRRLCVDCREQFTPDAILLKHLEDAFHISKNGGAKRIHELEETALKDGIGGAVSDKGSATSQLGSSATSIVRLWKAHEDGCERCNHTGYKGRIGIYEVLENSTEIQKMIVTGSTSESIEKAAIEDGMLTMQLDGFVKALRGQTTIEEVLRVTIQE